ncbi:MAG: hypothetical protein C0403_00400 [Desulfobacterium sp.]|nr:hypothetical protein [Desulfobacterium sp.]
MKNKYNNSGKLLFILLLMITIAVAAGGFFAYKFLNAEKTSDNEMANIHLQEETIAFVHQSMPDVYNSLFELNHEIVMIEKELKRLEIIENEYPKQKKIVQDEKKMWSKTQKDLQTLIENLEKNIEPLFVAYTVNTEKGTELLASKKEELLASATEALETSKKQTVRLKNTEEKSFIQKIKEKISK